jgi:hypothetical protein
VYASILTRASQPHAHNWFQGVTLALEKLGSDKVSLIKGLVYQLDSALDTLLKDVEKLVADVLKLVATLLVCTIRPVMLMLTHL